MLFRSLIIKLVLEQVPKPNLMIKPNQHIFVTVSKRPDDFIVPNLFGQDYNTISQKDVIPLKMFWLQSDYPKNFCIAQSPKYGRILSKKPFVAYFSAGKNQLVVFPDLKHRSADEVKNFLEKEDLNVEIIPDFYDVKECVVIDQKPMAGSIVDKSKKLYVQLQLIHKGIDG